MWRSHGLQPVGPHFLKLSLPKSSTKVYITIHILQLIGLTLRAEKGPLKGLKGSVFRINIAPA